MKGSVAVLIACAITAGSLRASLAQPVLPNVPPEVQAVLDKMKRGEQPTPADLDTIRKWGEKQSGGRHHRAPGAPKKMGKAAPTLAELGACPPAKKVALPAKAPSRSEYTALVKKLRDARGRKLAGEAKVIDKLLAKAVQKHDGADAGVIMYDAGQIDSAIYLTAASALADPGDAIAASNLSVILTDDAALADAQSVALYAAAAAPKEPAVLTNLGWIAFHAGDKAAATTRFEAALAALPAFPPAELGLGLIKSCDGDSAGEALLMSAATRMRAGSIGGLLAAATGNLTPPLVRAPPITLLPMPIDMDPALTAKWLPWVKSLSDMKGIMPETKAVPITPILRSWEGRIAVLGWLHTVLHDRMLQPVATKAATDAHATLLTFLGKRTAIFKQGVDRERACAKDRACSARAKIWICTEQKNLTLGTHPVIAEQLIKGWERTEPALRDWVEMSIPHVEGIGPYFQQQQSHILHLGSYLVWLSFANTAIQWVHYVDMALQDCNPSKVTASTPPVWWKMTIKEACAAGMVTSAQGGLGPVKLEIGCNTYKIDTGPLSVEYARNTRQFTVFTGPGVSGNFGTLNAEGKVGTYFVHEMGKGIVDYGFEGSAGVGAGPASWGPKVRYSLVSGWAPIDATSNTVKLW